MKIADVLDRLRQMEVTPQQAEVDAKGAVGLLALGAFAVEFIEKNGANIQAEIDRANREVAVT